MFATMLKRGFYSYQNINCRYILLRINTCHHCNELETNTSEQLKKHVRKHVLACDPYDLYGNQAYSIILSENYSFFFLSLATENIEEYFKQDLNRTGTEDATAELDVLNAKVFRIAIDAVFILDAVVAAVPIGNVTNHGL